MDSKQWSTIRRTWIAPYESLISFAVWNIVREQRLNIDALVAYLQRLSGAYLQSMRGQSGHRR